jgi:DNA-binding NarL/FixJ family response regulator
VVILPNRRYAASEADLALLDPFTRRSGVVGSAQVARPPGGTRVVIYTWETRSGFVERAMLAGASGYLSKALPAEELVAALEKVHLGERLVAVDEPRARHERSTTIEIGLTPRETDVVALIAAGAPNKEISRRLELSMNTVKSHIRTAYRAMGVTSRTQAVLWAVEHGITAPRLEVVNRAS